MREEGETGKGALARARHAWAELGSDPMVCLIVKPVFPHLPHPSEPRVGRAGS